MTDTEAAAENDPIFGEVQICRECARAKGGTSGEIVVSTFWKGTCLVCNQIKDCCHVRDYGWPGGMRPKKICKPDSTVTAPV